MSVVQIFEVLLMVASVVSVFIVVLRYLVRFQRKIDRILILTASSETRLVDIEKFLEKYSKFKPKQKLDDSMLPEVNTDFI